MGYQGTTYGLLDGKNPVEINDKYRKNDSTSMKICRQHPCVDTSPSMFRRRMKRSVIFFLIFKYLNRLKICFIRRIY